MHTCESVCQCTYVEARGYMSCSFILCPYYAFDIESLPEPGIELVASKPQPTCLPHTVLGYRYMWHQLFYACLLSHLSALNTLDI